MPQPEARWFLPLRTTAGVCTRGASRTDGALTLGDSSRASTRPLGRGHHDAGRQGRVELPAKGVVSAAMYLRHHLIIMLADALLR